MRPPPAPVPRLQRPTLAIPQPLQRQDRRVRQRRRLLEAHAIRDALEGIRRSRYVLRERPAAVVGEVGHDRVARLPSGHARPDRLHLAGDVPAHTRIRRPPQPQEQPHEPGRGFSQSRSARLTDAARTRTRTSPSPGTGASTSRTSTTSGPPYRSRCAALIGPSRSPRAAHPRISSSTRSFGRPALSVRLTRRDARRGARRSRSHPSAPPARSW